MVSMVDYSLPILEVGRNDRLRRSVVEKHSRVFSESNLNQTRTKRQGSTYFIQNLLKVVYSYINNGTDELLVRFHVY